MKRSVLIGLVLAGCAVLACGQEVKIQDNAPFTYAYLECSGSYQQIPVKMGEFMQAFFGQQLVPAGAPFGLYHNSPQQVKSEAELKWCIGMPVKKEAEVKSPLKKGDFIFPKVAVYMHVGPYEKVGESYAKVFEFIGKSGYRMAGPCLERYLNNPQQVKPEELKSEIVVPVEPVKK